MINTTFIDQKYIRFLSSRLNNFRDKGNGLFEFSHSCEKPSSRKRRGYFYKKGNGYNFMCHNCQASTKFFKFLEAEDTMLFKDYKLEVFKDSMSSRPEIVKLDVEPEEKASSRVLITGIVPYTDLPETHPAMKFIQKRGIPKELWNDLYFCRDFFPWASQFNQAFSKVKDKEPRFVIPYRDKKGEVFGFTCRSFGKSDRKYIEIKVDSDAEMIYGINRLNLAKTIFAVEGPIDSMFLPNSVAVGGANYQSEFLFKHKDNVIIIPDNDWKRNIDVLRKIEEAGRNGFRVALMPDTYKSKDINDAVVKDNISPEAIVQMAQESAKTGPELLLEIAFRRKC